MCSRSLGVFDDPIIIEFVEGRAGLDIGNTELGMHVKHVQAPYRHEIKKVGFARITGLYSRLKMIGGERSRYY